jgi:hypothetical protein
MLLFCSTYGCQSSRSATPLTRRHDLLQQRASFSDPSDDASMRQVAATADDVGASTEHNSSWTNWLDRIPRPPRIPLPRTDMGGSDIAVLETRTASATGGR